VACPGATSCRELPALDLNCVEAEIASSAHFLCGLVPVSFPNIITIMMILNIIISHKSLMCLPFASVVLCCRVFRLVWNSACLIMT
jgi:hypothetical protein